MNILSRKKNDGNTDFASSEDPLEDDNRRKKNGAIEECHGEWSILLQEPLIISHSSMGRGGISWAFLPMMECWRVQSYAGICCWCVFMTTKAVSLLEDAVSRHLPCPLALTVSLPTLLQCSSGLGGSGTDRDVPFRTQCSIKKKLTKNLFKTERNYNK